MRTNLQIIDGQPWFVIEGLDPAHHSAARKLGYTDVARGFGSAAPADSPNVLRAFNNFQRNAEPMILQAAGVLIVPWEETLVALADVLADRGLDWWLLGSAALAARGLRVTPGDVDVVVSDAGAYQLEELLLDYIVQPLIATPDWVHNSFARAFLHSRLEWVGGANAIADREYPSDQGPIAASRLEVITWKDHAIRVPPLDLQLETSRRRGLSDRAAIIEGAMA